MALCTARAPSRHSVQVGEMTARSRTLSALRLKRCVKGRKESARECITGVEGVVFMLWAC